ncbi:MAG: leucine-rich repeat protein [Bacteroidales bacterium]|nr:leucine-rich repeat protein [Bacteroidales bacterium]
MFAFTAMAQTTFTVGDLNYQVNVDNVSVTVTGHVNGYDAQGDLIIPASVSYGGTDYTVTAIGNSAFLYCFYLTSLSLPNTIITIEDSAFAYCSGFTGDLIIPNSVKTIGESAFFQCEGLNGKLIIGESVNYIGDWAFRKCSHISDAVSLSTTPAELGNDLGGMVFGEFGMPVLTVPCGCSEVYMNSAWYDPIGLTGFYEFIEDCSAVTEAESIISAVYPNPTSGIVKIEAENIQNISIFNAIGEKMFETTASGDNFEYNFSNNASGVYFVKVETSKGVETKRVTVK